MLVEAQCTPGVEAATLPAGCVMNGTVLEIWGVKQLFKLSQARAQIETFHEGCGKHYVLYFRMYM